MNTQTINREQVLQEFKDAIKKAMSNPNAVSTPMEMDLVLEPLIHRMKYDLKIYDLDYSNHPFEFKNDLKGVLKRKIKFVWNYGLHMTPVSGDVVKFYVGQYDNGVLFAFMQDARYNPEFVSVV